MSDVISLEGTSSLSAVDLSIARVNKERDYFMVEDGINTRSDMGHLRTNLGLICLRKSPELYVFYNWPAFYSEERN